MIKNLSTTMLDFPWGYTFDGAEFWNIIFATSIALIFWGLDSYHTKKEFKRIEENHRRSVMMSLVTDTANRKKELSFKIGQLKIQNKVGHGKYKEAVRGYEKVMAYVFYLSQETAFAKGIWSKSALSWNQEENKVLSLAEIALSDLFHLSDIRNDLKINIKHYINKYPEAQDYDIEFNLKKLTDERSSN